MKLKELDHHCGVLCELIIKGTEYFIDRVEWQQPLINLKIASGLKSLDYDATRFDDSIGWCGLADIMADHQEVLERKLVLELCRFHFIWSSLEAAMDVAVPLNFLTKPLGKVNKTCSFIKSKANIGIKFDSYLRELGYLEELLTEDSFYNGIFEEIEMPEHVDIFGKGIFLAYKLRNRLAHGALDIPITMQEEEEHLDADIVCSLSRLALFTIQFLAIVDLEADFPYFTWSGIDMPIRLALTNIQDDIHPEDVYPEHDVPVIISKRN